MVPFKRLQLSTELSQKEIILSSTIGMTTLSQLVIKWKSSKCKVNVVVTPLSKPKSPCTWWVFSRKWFSNWSSSCPEIKILSSVICTTAWCPEASHGAKQSSREARSLTHHCLWAMPAGKSSRFRKIRAASQVVALGTRCSLLFSLIRHWFQH